MMDGMRPNNTSTTVDIPFSRGIVNRKSIINVPAFPFKENNNAYLTLYFAWEKKDSSGNY
jgi:hypothetical protein